MQELELNYPTTKGKVYSEEEDRYLLCRLNHYGMTADDVYERIKKDITEFPVFRFDWFFKSRSPQELQRRCNTLLGMIEKEAEVAKEAEIKNKGGARGKVIPRSATFIVYCAYNVFSQKRGIDETKEKDSAPGTPSSSTAPAKKSHKKKKV